MAQEDDEVKAIAGNVVEALAGIEESFRQAKLELLKKENDLFRPLYAKREKLTAAIPRFWSTVLSIEDELLPYIKARESDLLKSCTTLRIERLADPRDFNLSMTFSRNEYLENTSLSLTKHFKFDGGRLTSNVVKLDWKKGKDLIEMAAEEKRLSFFTILNFVGADGDMDEDQDQEDPQLILEDMAILLADEVYPHALSYFTDALAPPETPADTPLDSRASTPIESMSHSFLDAQAIVSEQNQVGRGKHHQLNQNNSEIEQYSQQSSSCLPDWLMQHRSESITAFNEVKMITTNEAQFLHCLTTFYDKPSVLEIGCFTGFSALVFADAGAKEVVTCELDPDLSSFAKLGIHKANKSDIVSVITGDAHATIADPQKVRGKFDIIFIDAEKPGYLAYLKTILSRGLLAPRGVILADNTLRRGLVAGTEVLPRHPSVESPDQKRANDEFESGVIAMREFNEYVVNLTDLKCVLVPCWDGLSLIRYK